jgi:hypothetical protein
VAQQPQGADHKTEQHRVSCRNKLPQAIHQHSPAVQQQNQTMLQWWLAELKQMGSLKSRESKQSAKYDSKQHMTAL